MDLEARRLKTERDELLQVCRECLEFLGQIVEGETVESRLGLVGGYYAAQRLRNVIARVATKPQPTTT